ncbi:hypothetical protein R50072_07260 [Simiduia litorea]|uniref:heme utilization cystosolic carrier protein HutX n=1 Tax=Simiduia litorea TaxID=1435348 RepID=UPI0036F367CA
MNAEIATTADVLPGHFARALLDNLTSWGAVTTIVVQAGCVFEFKGNFPKGQLGNGYWNLDGPVPGFHGHINLAVIDHVAFQDRPHQGRQALALVFVDKKAQTIFKVFLGRDHTGALDASQVEKFRNLQRVLAL